MINNALPPSSIAPSWPIIQSMMLTLFKTDALNRTRFYTIHDLQKSLLGGFALTVNSSIGDKCGKDRLMHFTSEEEAGKWFSKTLKVKTRAGYKPLYRYASARDSASLLGRYMTRLAG